MGPNPISRDSFVRIFRHLFYFREYEWIKHEHMCHGAHHWPIQYSLDQRKCVAFAVCWKGPSPNFFTVCTYLARIYIPRNQLMVLNVPRCRHRVGGLCIGFWFNIRDQRSGIIKATGKDISHPKIYFRVKVWSPYRCLDPYILGDPQLFRSDRIPRKATTLY